MSVIPVEIQDMRKMLSDRFDEFSVQKDTNLADKQYDVNDGERPVNVTSIVVLHMLAQCIKVGRPLDTKIFRKEQRYFSGIIFGFIHALRMFRPCEIDIDVAGSVVAVRSLGKLDLHRWLQIDPSAFSGAPQLVLRIFYENMKLKIPTQWQNAETPEDDKE